jgi:penicillin-binding protein 1B
VEIFPGRDSHGAVEPGIIEFSNGKVSRIVSLQDHTERQSLALEPRLLANLSQARERRRLVKFGDLPPQLVQAVISTEDKHFFRHSGFDLLRIFKAAYVDLKNGRKKQGASTLTMQLARGLWLDPDKSWKRKTQEFLITIYLEKRLSKQEIFEHYANQVYLGRSHGFSIHGFGEAARVFFGKHVAQLTVPESALLAGLVQRPSYLNPYRHPERAQARRNVVLALMRENGYLTDADYRVAVSSPVKLNSEQADSPQIQYFVDLAIDELQNRLDDREKQVQSIYTTLDPELQAAAEQAVTEGIREVDQQLKRKKLPAGPGQPQVALVALDPRTGEIKSLVGGRNYVDSQLNHALAMRPPGSVFKPFVYAAALETAIQGGSRIITSATVLSDEPTSFQFGKVVYEPGNFDHQFMGEVTVRTALTRSLNVATVALAEQVGYGRVVDVARRAGLNKSIQPTPSVALGAYESTPLEMAGAYTIFANQGRAVTPTTIALARAHGGGVLYQREGAQRRALDPRVAFLVTNLMQGVIANGTGAGVRGRGFWLPAAGKTGTAHDGWFAGFTSELLAVVWVGFDDYRELKLEGARSALPIWTDFMKRAAKLRDYRAAKPFNPPPGVVSAGICSESGQLEGAWCPDVRPEFFVDGTQPVVECQMHSSQRTQGFAERLVQLIERVGR